MVSTGTSHNPLQKKNVAVCGGTFFGTAVSASVIGGLVVVQWLERWTYDREVVGLTPSQFLRTIAGTAIACLSHRNSVLPSARLSDHTGGSGKNGAS